MIKEFNKLFPSLKGKGYGRREKPFRRVKQITKVEYLKPGEPIEMPDYKEETTIEEMIEIPIKDIQKHCLDKARIKEAILKAEKKFAKQVKSGGFIQGTNIFLLELKEELGLD